MNRTAFTIRVVLLLSSVLPASPAMSADKVTLQLKWKHQFQFAGYYAAIEKGYYREAGLQVRLREGRPGLDPLEEMIDGRADFAVFMPDAIVARQQGRPVVALAAIFQHSPLALFASRASGITDPQGLAGKRVMVRTDGNDEIFAMLQREGVKKSQIDFVPHTWDIDDLISGRVDAMAGYVTDLPFLLKERGLSFVTIMPVTYGIDFYGDCLFTTDGEIRDHPRRVASFLAASIRGWDYAMRHPREIAELIFSRYSQRLPVQSLLNEAKAMRGIMQPDVIEIGHMNPGRWKHIADTLVSLGMLRPGYSLDGFLYRPGQVENEAFKRLALAVITLGGAAALTSLVLLLFNRRLRRAVTRKTRELEEEKSFSEAILKAMPGHFFMYENGERLVRWNETMQQATGMSDAELTNRGPLDFIAEQDREAARQAIEKVFATGQGEVEAAVVLRGREYPYYHTGALLERGGKKYLLGVSIDLTERKKLEGQLRQAQKMETIGRLAGGVAHDFNNILTSILGYSELLLARMADDDPGREDVAVIRSAGKRAADLVRQLLAFSRKQILEKTELDINVVISGLLKILDKTLGDNVSIRASLEARGLILADRGQIEQVIMNLAINARDAMPAGGEIRITTRDVAPKEGPSESARPGSHIMLEVTDNGEGMDPEVVEHIFEPFYTTKAQGKGTGLGLATVQGIVRQHGGDIEVKSEKGRGTTFRIYLPAHAPGGREA